MESSNGESKKESIHNSSGCYTTVCAKGGVDESYVETGEGLLAKPCLKIAAAIDVRLL